MLLVVCASCKKQEEPAYEDAYKYFDGKITATRNGKDWPLLLAAVYDSIPNKKHVGIHISDVRDNGIWDELSVRNIPPQAGVYPLITYWEWSRTTDPATKEKVNIKYNGSFGEGADVGGGNHYLSNDVTPLLTIDYCDTNRNLVSGTLQVGFRLVDPAGSNRPIDSVIYRNCRFSATIHDYTKFYITPH